ncbi:hypothetical protein LJR290_005840 [Variovorax sp. LjRoot290]|uniref:hypothetical protein n=1 Tax=unclassified Variovorax TaxID=663243 RepID=UPI003ED08CCB
MMELAAFEWEIVRDGTLVQRLPAAGGDLEDLGRVLPCAVVRVDVHWRNESIDVARRFQQSDLVDLGRAGCREWKLRVRKPQQYFHAHPTPP